MATEGNSGGESLTETETTPNSIQDLTSLLSTSSLQNPGTSDHSTTTTTGGESSETPPTPKKKDKINVLLKPVGDAPILKDKLWAVDPDRPVSGIIQFIRPRLRLGTEDSLFVFVNQSFAPSPDQLIRNLYECFGSNGKLILHYSTTTAWG